MDQPSDDLRAAVAATARALGAGGLVHGTTGNVSARRGDHVAVTATGAVLAELTAEQVTVVDRDGRVVAGELAPTSELDLHLGIYARFDHGAVVHTHAPYATALSCVLDELPAVHYEMALLGGPVRVAPYATFGTPALAGAVLEALAGRGAALMAHHGAVVCGPDPATAHRLTELLEFCCATYWRAAAIGTPRTLDAEALRAVSDEIGRRRYGATRPI